MSDLFRDLTFLRSVLDHLDEITEQWPLGRLHIAWALQPLGPGASEDLVRTIADRILSASPAGPARHRLQQLRDTAGPAAADDREEDIRDLPARDAARAAAIAGIIRKKLSLGLLAPGERSLEEPEAPPPERPVGAESGSRRETGDSVPESGGAVHGASPPPPQSAPGPGDARYLNTFFEGPDGEEIGVDDHLVRDVAYMLCVEVSPARRGPDADDEPFPEATLQGVWAARETLPLTVVVASRDFVVEGRFASIQLPREGASPMARFAVRPLRSRRRCALQVEVLFRGHLLQSKRIEAYVAPAKGPTAAPEHRQAAYVTFASTTRLDPETLDTLPQRILTVDVERDPRDGSIEFRFFDYSGGGGELAYFDTELQPDALGSLLRAARSRLKRVVTGSREGPAVKEGYEWKVQGDDALLDTWLPELADVGRSLYRKLLPAAEGDAGAGGLAARLAPGAVIQVNPVLGLVTLPWALLYERKFMLVEGKNRVCEQFAARPHDCAGCPNAADPSVVCPHAFWGFRYAIEQLPCWTAPGSAPQERVWSISNGLPLNVSFNVFRGFQLWSEHLRRLEAAGSVAIHVAEDLPELQKVWEEEGAQLDLVYFYCHGGVDADREPYLQLSTTCVRSNILDAIEAQWPRNPLVFLNGCATGDYGPDSYTSLIADFRRSGACGVVGTECAVPELFAEAYAAELFPRLFRGEPLGAAMLAVRREFLLARKNPLALAYTLYAAHEIAFAHPVSPSAPATREA